MKILYICIAGNLEYLQFRRFLEFSDKIEHAYTLKPMDFKDLDKDILINNCKNICRALNLDYRNIYIPGQTHGTNVVSIKGENSWIYGGRFPNTDGLITDKKDKILSLTFADCICLYFYDPVKNIIANIHSGWRGTYEEIAKTCVDNLIREYGVNPKDLICRNCT